MVEDIMLGNLQRAVDDGMKARGADFKDQLEKEKDRMRRRTLRMVEERL
jgi:hypothetical protein